MTQLDSFAAANQYLAEFYKNVRTPYVLDNMRQLMTYLGNPQDSLKVVHVAGTSGKTSTVYYLSALLTAAGYKTGLTVSPHIDEINERVQLNGQPLAEKEFCQALSEFLDLVERSGVQPSWFEVMIAFAYWYFAREQVDYAVVEVGLGGLLDGTNVISRSDKVCIITDIGLDHTAILGKTVEQIAAQKIGIVQPGNQVFSYHQSPAVDQGFEARAKQQKAMLEFVDIDATVNPVAANTVAMPDYQLRNWLLAYHVYRFLEKRDQAPPLTGPALQQTQHLLIPGRMEVRQIGGKTVIMDGAHNVQKITALIDTFEHQYPGKKPAILLALRGGKEYQDIAARLAPLSGHVIVTTFETAQDVPVKSMPAEALAEAFRVAGTPKVEAITDHNEAVEALMKVPEDICLITGSFYLISQVRNNQHLV
jgi:dihydrofolate synthase/folylpolyglutamate synthase